QPLRKFDARNIALSSAMAQLKNELAAVLVHPFAEFAPERNALVAIDGCVVGDDAPSDRHRHEARDNRPYAAAREFGLPVDPVLRPRSVVVVKWAGDVRPHDATLDGQIPELERFKKDVSHRDPRLR